MSDLGVPGNAPRSLYAGTTFVKIPLHQYYAHCVFLLCFYRAFYTIKPINMRSKYDQGVPVRCMTVGVLDALVMRFYCTHGALLYKSAINCLIPSFIYWSSEVMDLLSHAAAIQIAVPQEDLLLDIEEAERKRHRPKRFWVRAWLTDERWLQFYMN